MRVAFLGLGVMGQGMARRILSKGHDLTVYNRTPERAADLAQAGARVAATPREAVSGTQIVVTMVANDAALRAVAEGDEGFLAALAAGTTVVQMSTVGPDTTLWLAGEVAAHAAQMLDCPVLGSLPEAQEGRLSLLAGGKAEVIERVSALLLCLGRQIYHVGELGQATRFKLCNNLVSGGLVAALAEGVALLETAGLDPQLYIQVLKDSQLPERLMIGKATLMATGDFEPRFSLDNMAKDIQLAVAMGQEYGLDLHQGRASHATFTRGATAVGGDRDMAAAVAGVPVGRPTSRPGAGPS